MTKSAYFTKMRPDNAKPSILRGWMTPASFVARCDEGERMEMLMELLTHYIAHPDSPKVIREQAVGLAKTFLTVEESWLCPFYEKLREAGVDLPLQEWEDGYVAPESKPTKKGRLKIDREPASQAAA